MKVKRCNYCRSDAVAWFSYRSCLASTRQRWFTVTVAACAEHEGCVNWKSLRDSHPDAPIQRSA